MSILLDALKRSESRRELGTVPTLQTSTDLLNRSSGEPPSWLAAAMVLLAISLMTWLGLQQFQLPDTVLTPELAELPAVPPDTGVADSSGLDLAESSEQTVDEKSSTAEQSILPKFTGAKVLNSERANAEKARLEAQLRANGEVRNYVDPEQDSAVSNEPALDDALRRSELPKVEIAGRDRAIAATSSSTVDEYEPEMISYWQVPEALREGLPDLRISVLVFAEQPENRFVLLNGERLREGEELPNGLLLEEIRRDRAIFNYRNYRFYLKS